MKSHLLLSAVVFAVIGSSAAAQNRPVFVEPPVQISPAPIPPASKLFDYVPGPVACAGAMITPRSIERPFPVSGFAEPGAPGLSISFAFRIDADGRPLGIKRELAKSNKIPRAYIADGDVAPALAAWRFAPGREYAQCRVTFEAMANVLADAPLPLLQRYFVAPHNRTRQERQLFKQIHPADSNCIGANAPELRLRAFPAFNQIPQAPGTWSYAMAGFDIDASGKPINVHIVGSDGNAVLERETIAAVARSRFGPAAKHGCTYPYYRKPTEPLQAPNAPDPASLAPADAKCPGDQTAWTSMPELRFPQGFQDRSIEGWAIVGYDVAPWGQTGNVRVLAAEPAEMFGEQARSIVGNARQAASPAGRSGCVDVVRFVMPNKDHPAPSDD